MFYLIALTLIEAISRDSPQHGHKHTAIATVSSYTSSLSKCTLLGAAQLQFDGFLTQQSVSDADASVHSLPQDIIILEEGNELEDPEELYPHQSEESQEASVISKDDSIAARIMASAMPDHFSLMEGSMESADWTALDQEAVIRSSADDNLSWSIVVSCIATCEAHSKRLLYLHVILHMEDACLVIVQVYRGCLQHGCSTTRHGALCTSNFVKSSPWLVSDIRSRLWPLFNATLLSAYS